LQSCNVNNPSIPTPSDDGPVSSLQSVPHFSEYSQYNHPKQALRECDTPSSVVHDHMEDELGKFQVKITNITAYFDPPENTVSTMRDLPGLDISDLEPIEISDSEKYNDDARRDDRQTNANSNDSTGGTDYGNFLHNPGSELLEIKAGHDVNYTARPWTRSCTASIQMRDDFSSPSHDNPFNAEPPENSEKFTIHGSLEDFLNDCIVNEDYTMGLFQSPIRRRQNPQTKLV